MISFLRKFRLLISPGASITKYLGYAIGEIFLLVIGILIALQVNNWNEGRKNLHAEQVLLRALLQEFESNARVLDETMARNEANIASGLELGRYTGPDVSDIVPLKLSQILVGAFKDDPHFYPYLGTIEDIVNSGRLSLFNDAELRKAISSWQSELERIKMQEDFVRNRRDAAQEYFLKNGNFRQHLNILGAGAIGVTQGRFPANQFKFLQLPEFESQLYLYIVASKNLGDEYYLPLKRKIEATRALIKQNLQVEMHR